ncbi:MAG: hypothetical protein K9G64_03090 [Bacteroidia bacterium]|nr:hypothetical protein [Bacteroidia bacterium]
MKKINILAALLFCSITYLASAQNIKDYSKLEKSPSFYIGVGSGLNYNCGLVGLKLTGRVNDKILIDASVGAGSWGNKLGLGLILNAKDENAWCPVISVSSATGLENVPTQIEAINKNGYTTTATRNVTLNPAIMINLGVQRQWIRPKGNRITLELGYSVLVSGGGAKLTDPDYQFTDRSKQVFEILKPGGFTIGFGYYFALN